MDEQQRASVGARVRRARKAHDWTQQQLAKEAGVATGTVNSVEGGRSTRPGNLRAVLDAVGLSPMTDTQEAPADDRIALALDLVRKWLEATPPEEVDRAVRDLTRFTMLRD